MLEEIQKLIAKDNIFSHHNQGILVARVQDTHQGFNLAKEVIYNASDNKAILYLSGGRTPKDLYRKLSEEEKLEVGGAGLIDERFGPKFHENSNEKMLRDSGLLRYLQMRDIKFYPILGSHPGGRKATDRISRDSIAKFTLSEVEGLQNDDLRKKTAADFDEKIRELHNLYQKSIGVLGVGIDGHTAGLPAIQNIKLKSSSFAKVSADKQIAKLYDTFDLVTEYNDTSGVYGERVTMTFLGLSMLDLNLVLVFGDDKKEALEKMFSDGPEEDIPSRFFKRPEIAEKTVLITDQNV